MERLDPPGQNNAKEGEEHCDEVFPDDGRWTDGEDHGGDWGSHGYSDSIGESMDISEWDVDPGV